MLIKKSTAAKKQSKQSLGGKALAQSMTQAEKTDRASKGGVAAAAAMTKKQRMERARAAVAARWGESEEEGVTAGLLCWSAAVFSCTALARISRKIG